MGGVFCWWHFMPKLEPISSEARKLSPDACASKAGTGVQPEKPSLELFFYFPRRISFLVERVGFSGWFSSF
jgi:hypothetical protein